MKNQLLPYKVTNFELYFEKHKTASKEIGAITLIESANNESTYYIRYENIHYMYREIFMLFIDE